MDLEFKTLTFKIDGLWAEKRVFNHNLYWYRTSWQLVLSGVLQKKTPLSETIDRERAFEDKKCFF